MPVSDTGLAECSCTLTKQQTLQRLPGRQRGRSCAGAPLPYHNPSNALSVRCLAVKSPVVERQSPSSSSLTQLMLEAVPGGRSYAGLQAADRAWHNLCHLQSSAHLPRQVIQESRTPLPDRASMRQYDIVVLGGTLGIFLATALLMRGHSVLVLERNRLQGRDQDWNISRTELQVFVDCELLTADELEEVIRIEFNPVRMAFAGQATIETRDILNCGVSPRRVLDIVKRRFLQQGGELREGASFDSAAVHADGVKVEYTAKRRVHAAAGGAGGEGSATATSYTVQQPADEQVSVAAGVVIDAMGAWSPIATQGRRGAPPDSCVLMVGSCATGLPPAHGADLLSSFTPLNKQRRLQYFWEAFPAQDGLTTYMFAYADPKPGRASLQDMFDDYLQLLPEYRGCADLQGVRMQRAIFGVVPNWHAQPLVPVTSRLLHIGDAAGNRSALSFAGFGALARNLRRLTEGLDAAIAHKQLSRNALALLQPHSPAISLTAAMQYSMGTRAEQDLDDCDPDIINNYIGGSFGQMQRMGESVYRPFMKDYLQFSGMARIVGGQLATRPGDIVAMTLFMHSAKAGQLFASEFALLGVYTALYRLALVMSPVHEWLLRPFPALLFRWQRLVEAFEYGSASDYKD